MKISQAKIEEMDAVRKLFTEYQQWLGIDLSFQDFETELRELPGCYAAPTGAIFLATENSKPVGCVAIRQRSGNEAELKRMYVVPEAREQGVAKASCWTLCQAWNPPGNFIPSLALSLQHLITIVLFPAQSIIAMYAANKSFKAASLDSLNRRMLRILRAACVCPLALR